MSEKTVILFMAHYLNHSVLNAFESLRVCGSLSVEVRMLYDNSKQNFDGNQLTPDANIYLYDMAELVNHYPFLNASDSIVPGNCIFPMLLFAKGNDFDYFWRIEHDARFSGDWNYFFNSFSNNSSDLLGTTLFGYDVRPDWNWWQSLKTPFGPLEKRSLVRGFFPVVRLSRKAIRLLQRSYMEGWRGHDEVSIPTILKYYECSIEDIGGNGEYVPSGNRDRFYTNNPESSGLAPGTFVYYPPHTDSSGIPNMLYHPVKDE